MRKYYYKIDISYIGHQYFGMQKQKEFPTICGEMEKVCEKILGKDQFYLLHGSRTDSKVSALHNCLKLTTYKSLPNSFIKELNSLLPTDIIVEKVEKSTKGFKVIFHQEQKEYLYLFSDASDPVTGPFIFNLEETLDIELLKKGVAVFKGAHDFANFHYRGTSTNTVREILEIEIVKESIEIFNQKIPPVYILKVKGTGFLKQMIRIIMGSLINLGTGQISLDDLKESLTSGVTKKVGFITPGHALILKKLTYRQSASTNNILA